MHPGLGAPTTGGMTQPGSGIPWSGRPGEHVSVLRGTPYRHEKRGDGWVMQSAAPTIETITGYPPHELLGDNGRSYLSIVHPDDLPLVSEVVTVAVERREPYAVEYRIVHADGSTRWVQGHGQPIQGADGEVRVIDGVLFDVTERRTSEERLAHLALHDPLTDLPNRALFQEHLTVAIANARRSGTGGAVLFIDLDDFKLVNDSFGHAVGDELLVLVARRLRESCRAGDVVARQGGDEFLVLVQGAADSRARGGRPGRRREPAHRPREAVRAREHRPLHHAEHRREPLPRRRRHRRDAPEARRHRHVRRQGRGPRRLPPLPAAEARLERRARDRLAAAPGRAARRARALLPADRRPLAVVHRRRRGAPALEPSRGRHAAARPSSCPPPSAPA